MAAGKMKKRIPLTRLAIALPLVRTSPGTVAAIASSASGSYKSHRIKPR